MLLNEKKVRDDNVELFNIEKTETTERDVNVEVISIDRTN
jgi:hypothetical protein